MCIEAQLTHPSNPSLRTQIEHHLYRCVTDVYWYFALLVVPSLTVSVKGMQDNICKHGTGNDHHNSNY